MCHRGGYSPKGVDTRRCANKDAGPKGGRFGRGPTSIGERRGRWALKGWILVSHFGWGGEQNTIYKEALRGSPKGKAQSRQYLLAVDLGRYTHSDVEGLKP